jgi:hypothetical protein
MLYPVNCLRPQYFILMIEASESFEMLPVSRFTVRYILVDPIFDTYCREVVKCHILSEALPVIGCWRPIVLWDVEEPIFAR